jgi:predicted TIM-barrel fold metal-dependent hydrolase
MPPPEELLPAMKRQRIIGWRLYPGPCRFLLKEFVLRDWLELARAHHLPLFLDTAHGATLEQVADFLERVPELTLVLTYNNDWPSDRYLRPFVASFPNVYLDLKHMITDGGIESFVEAYGSSRLLYGSGYPDAYFGANMMMVRHAQVPEADRAAIAGGNLARLVEEVAL